MCGRKKQLTYWWLDRRERAKKRQGTRQPLKGNPGDLLTPLRLHFLTVTLAGHSSMDHSISEAGSLRFSCISIEPWLGSRALVCVLGGIVPSCNPNNIQHCYQLWFADELIRISRLRILSIPLLDSATVSSLLYAGLLSSTQGLWLWPALQHPALGVSDTSCADWGHPLEATYHAI